MVGGQMDRVSAPKPTRVSKQRKVAAWLRLRRNQSSRPERLNSPRPHPWSDWISRQRFQFAAPKNQGATTTKGMAGSVFTRLA
jgi:hypothetical protein